MALSRHHARELPHRDGTKRRCKRNVAARSGWLAAFSCCALANTGIRTPAHAAGGTAVIHLPESATTSAGIFDAEDRLVRTLWSGQRRARGSLTIRWDGRDDEGHELSAQGRYSARVLAHNIRYRWQGVIGNTSADEVGTHVFRAYLPIHDMAFDAAGYGFYVVGYNERQAGIHYFRVSNPRRQDALAHEDGRRVFRYVATDGRLVYVANIGLPAAHPGDLRDAETFVVALKVADGTEQLFPAGRRVGTELGSVWQSAIDYDDESQDAFGRLRLAPTGLAVQQHGAALFVAHGGAGEIRVLDKRSGALIGRIAAAGAGDMEVAPDDSLWVLCKTGTSIGVRHFGLRGGQWVSIGEITTGLVNPVAIGVSPVDATVVVADAGTEQLKAFDAAGHALWVLGRAGGYREGGPKVTRERFGFSGGPTYVAFQADGSFWFGDPSNERDLHYSAHGANLSAHRAYLGEIMYLPHSRVVAVDAANPTRVFSGFMEFAVDYAQPLPRSWRLVRNWSAGLDARYRGEFEGLQAVCTLPDGRTFGVLRRFDLNRNELVELTRAGIRGVGATIDFNTKLYADCSLRLHLIRNASLRVYSRRLQTFDSAGLPQWAPPVLLASVSTLQPDDPYYHDVPFIPGINEATYPETGSGIVVSFNPGVSRGFHLGGIDPRGGWLWRASPIGSWDVDDAGNLEPRDGRYEIDHGVQYPGNVVTVSGRNIVFGYHGEGWRGGEADQWLHFYDDGLFVGQFGTPGLPRPAAEQGAAVAGFAGNAFSPQLVTVDGRVYLWHNDESGHGGVHRWWLEGARSIRVLEAPMRLSFDAATAARSERK